MSRIITNRRLFVLLASLILVIIVAGLTLRGRAATLPERLIMDVQNSVGGLLYRPVSRLTSFLQGVHDLREMYQENAQLKAELQNYNALQAQLADAQAEIARLNQMLGFKQGAGAAQKLIPAHVIGRDPAQWASELTLDVGRRDGVNANMAVIAADGSLVGRVAVAADNSCKVLLVTDTQVGDGVSARVQTPGTDQPFGIVVGSASHPGQLELTFLSPVVQVQPGQRVVTSELSDIFPPGIVIGTVQQVQHGLQGLTQSALITPAANLDYLQDVFVVVRTGTHT
ncbi:MAG: rod shape-determining protein MreC [Alicyclobacillus sp.]|nr:rod shape-determining protein MreC [Alicyclobacillus sp.]